MTPIDSSRHVFRHEPEFPAESKIMQRFIRPGMRVLDIGTAATGRSARLMARLGATVFSVEINETSLHEFNSHPERPGLHLAAADMADLPYNDRAFDLILIAFHGFDYLLDDAIRGRAIHQFDRLLKPGGHLIFNSFNPLGIVFTPEGLTTRWMLKVRLEYILRANFLKRTLIDFNQLELVQATPWRHIREIEDQSTLAFSYATDTNGSSTHLTRVAFFSTEPYYIFSKPA